MIRAAVMPLCMLALAGCAMTAAELQSRQPTRAQTVRAAYLPLAECVVKALEGAERSPTTRYDLRHLTSDRTAIVTATIPIPVALGVAGPAPIVELRFAGDGARVSRVESRVHPSYGERIERDAWGTIERCSASAR